MVIPAVTNHANTQMNKHLVCYCSVQELIKNERTARSAHEKRLQVDCDDQQEGLIIDIISPHIGYDILIRT